MIYGLLKSYPHNLNLKKFEIIYSERNIFIYILIESKARLRPVMAAILNVESELVEDLMENVCNGEYTSAVNS